LDKAISAQKAADAAKAARVINSDRVVFPCFGEIAVRHGLRIRIVPFFSAILDKAISAQKAADAVKAARGRAVFLCFCGSFCDVAVLFGLSPTHTSSLFQRYFGQGDFGSESGGCGQSGA